MTWVYVAQQVQRKRLVKVVMTDDLDARLTTLRLEQRNPLNLLCSQVFELRSTARKVEGGIHRYFEDARYQGEWFHPQAELLRIGESSLIRFAANVAPPVAPLTLHVSSSLKMRLRLGAIEARMPLGKYTETILRRGLP